MLLKFTHGGVGYSFNSNNYHDLSIHLHFNDAQPNFFDVPKAESRAVEYGDFVGDTRKGGSCNFEQYRFITHCNGTHTECIGHLINDRIAITDILTDVIEPAALITVDPAEALDTIETYKHDFKTEDKVITKDQLQHGLKSINCKGLGALLIRTIPNDNAKKRIIYSENAPAFFTHEAIEFINECGFKHLLVDLPTLDRMNDEGMLSSHRKYWGLPEGSKEYSEAKFKDKTITEMIYIENGISDGIYLLNMQIAPFKSDAAPSRPVIFPLISL